MITLSFALTVAAKCLNSGPRPLIVWFMKLDSGNGVLIRAISSTGPRMVARYLITDYIPSLTLETFVRLWQLA